MKRILMICGMLLALVGSIHADDQLVVEALEVIAGDHANLNIKLKNSTSNLTAYQMRLTLPDGLDLQKDEEGHYVYALSSRHNKTTHGLTILPQKDGSYLFICYSDNNATLGTASSSATQLLSVGVAATVAMKDKKGETLKGKVSDIVFSNTSGEKTRLEDADASLSVVYPIIVVENKTRKYGEENPTLTYTVEGVTGGKSAMHGEPELYTDATLTSSVGSYDIRARAGTIYSYFEVKEATLTVTKSPLTITADNLTVKQGEPTPELTVTYTGFKNDEDASVLIKQPTVMTDRIPSSATGTYTITVSAAEAENYDITYKNGTLRVITADGVVVTAKSYEREYGEENPKFEYVSEGKELTGTPSITCEATKTSDVGTYVIKAEKGSVQNFNDSYVNGILTIVRAPLTISGGEYHVRQGDPMPELVATYTGFKNDETEDVLIKKPVVECDATSDSEPGEYEVKVYGAEAKNYLITHLSGKLIIETAEDIILTANSYTRVYGDANPTFEFTTSGAALKGGKPVITCEATETSPVGTYPIVIKKGTVENHSDTYVNGVLTITPAPLVVRADDKTREYGDENPTFTATYTGFKNGETADVLTTPPTFATTAKKTSWIGTFDITASEAEAENYTISYETGTLSIEKAPLVITPDDKSRQQGEENPTFTFSCEGFKNDETVAVLTKQPTLVTEATATSPTGIYDIIARGAEAENYAISYNVGKLRVTNADEIFITALDTTIVYGEPIENLRFKAEGATLKGEPDISCDVPERPSVGTYEIVISKGRVENFNDHYVNGTLTIVPAKLIVRADDKTREYGEANPELTYQYEGFKYEDTEAVLDRAASISCAATQRSDVGEYVIELAGAAAENYTFEYEVAKLTVTPAPLTVSVATDYVRNEGTENPEFQLKYSGWKLGQDESVLVQKPTATTEAKNDSAPGVYAITVGGGEATNYVFSYEGATLTVLKTIQLTINALGRGTVGYEDSEIRQGAERFTMNVRQTADLRLIPDENFHLASILVNNSDVTEDVEEEHLSIGPFEEDASVWVRYESNFTAEDSVTFTVRIEGFGVLTIDDELFDTDGTMRAAKGRDYVILFKPDEEKRLGRLTLNDAVMDVQDNRFIIYDVQADTTIVATFVDDLPMFEENDIAYAEIKGDIGKVKVMPLQTGYGRHVDIPETVEHEGKTFTVAGIDETAFRGTSWLMSIHIPATIEASNTGYDLFRQCENLAAIIWDAPLQLTRERVGNITNANMLYYVTDRKYAPSFNNVIVNGEAERIILDGENSKFLFYCPRTFHVQKIDYYYYFSLETRKHECRGWETIALPFDVTTITHQNGPLTPFSLFDYDKGLDDRPFWLYEYTEDDTWREAAAIKANTPYLISMPNDPAYIEEYRLNGGVTFIGEDVNVLSSDEESLVVTKGQKRSFIPTFQQIQVGDLPFYALNTEKWRSYEAGSIFRRNQRNLRPFEAYFLNESSEAKEDFFSVFEETTGITDIAEVFGKRGNTSENEHGRIDVYDVAGRKANVKGLKAGLYIIDGRKVVVK